jgi:hypothetical protein
VIVTGMNTSNRSSAKHWLRKEHYALDNCCCATGCLVAGFYLWRRRKFDSSAFGYSFSGGCNQLRNRPPENRLVESSTVRLSSCATVMVLCCSMLFLIRRQERFTARLPLVIPAQISLPFTLKSSYLQSQLRDPHHPSIIFPLTKPNW